MRRKNFGAKPYSYPQPVLIVASYDENGIPDAMNAAWGGISYDNEISICLGSDHKTVKNILFNKAFTVSMADAAHIEACDYLGMVSANDVPDKLAKSGLTVSKSDLLNAPIINELAVCIECRMKSYDEATCRMVGEIVNVSVDEAFITDGKADTSKISPVTFDPFNNEYYVIGRKVADAFSAGSALIR